MSRPAFHLILVACVLGGCDDGVLRAFEPRATAIGGESAGGQGPQAGGGVGGATPIDPAGAAGLPEPGSPLLIDDFEDGDVRSKEPRGWWYPVNDGTGLQGFGIEPVNRGPASAYALRTHGNDFGDWGAAIGVNLVGDAAPLNLEGYTDLCFFARVDAATSAVLEVHFLRDEADHYSREVSLSETWSRHCLPLADFKKPDEVALVPRDLIALQFFFPPSSPFAFWLDDVEIAP
jgi:hypothetical protein